MNNVAAEIFNAESTADLNSRVARVKKDFFKVLLRRPLKGRPSESPPAQAV